MTSSGVDLPEEVNGHTAQALTGWFLIQSNRAPDWRAPPPAERHYHFKQVQQYSDNLTAHVMTCFNYPPEEPLAPADHSFNERQDMQRVTATSSVQHIQNSHIGAERQQKYAHAHTYHCTSGAHLAVTQCVLTAAPEPHAVLWSTFVYGFFMDGVFTKRYEMVGEKWSSLYVLNVVLSFISYDCDGGIVFLLSFTARLKLQTIRQKY